MNNHFVWNFLKENKRIILLFFLFSFLIYANSILNDFTVVDDLAGFVQNQTIRNIGESFKSFNLQTITYAISYGLFGMTSTPLRILAIINHSIVAIMLYAMMSTIFNRKTAMISGLLFIAHPVNTESLNWISAQFYIVMTGFLYSAILSHILYRRTADKRYLFLTGAIITLEFLLIKHAWVLVVPAAVVVVDFFLVKKRFDFIFYSTFAAILSPILIFYIFGNLFTSIEQRQTNRMAVKGGTLVNQQLLAPVDEGYPYSVFTLTRLYSFPKDLTMYYDGNPVTKNDLNYMRVVLFLYIAAFVFFLFKDKRISGLLLMLLLLIAPVFAPQKITWYMTERYLYSGTGFFTTLVALLIVYVEKKIHWKQFTVITTILLLGLYSVRTFMRNLDWKDTETIAKATIQSSPYTVRPYNDAGGYYIMNKRYEEAKKSYVQALKVGASGTAQKNLGYIYLISGLDPGIKTLSLPYEQIVMNGINALEAKDYESAMYFLNEAYGMNSMDTRVLNSLGTIYADTESLNNAEQLLQKSLSVNDKNADTYYALGYVAFKQGNKALAIQNLQEALKLNPDHNEAKTNLNILLDTK